MLKTIFIAILSFVALSTQQQRDPLKDFCRLFGHQTTVVDRKQYIDGGLVNWTPLSPGSTNYTSTWIRQGNLDQDNDGFPQQNVLAKNESVPSVQGGVLWADTSNKVVYMYGGEYGNGKPDEFKLWYYDIIYNTWNVSNASTADVRRASWGAGAVSQDKGRGYYYGGWLTNTSVPGYNSQTALKNLLVYDMIGSSFRNLSGPDDIPRAEGVMLYLPTGDAGMLVYFGGVEQPFGNSTTRGLNMTNIWTYDIGNDKWYKELASGAVPEQRRRFCAGATWAPDRSSYNIYLYGGASIGDGVGFGDVYVLSLPSFKWIKFWPLPEDNVGSTFPHHSLSCDVIGSSQMIIMGGTFPNTSDCDVPTIYGQHGLDLGKQNAKGAKWALFNPNLTTYKVPSDIAQSIGGGPSGGATILAPTGGWANRDLNTQFARPYTPTARSPTRQIPTPTAPATPSPTAGAGGSNKGAIIGGAVGGAIGGLLIVAAVAICFFRRKKKAKKAESSPRPPSELPSNPAGHPHGGPAKSPAMSTHPFAYATPHGSPPPASEGWGSQYNHAAPEYPGPPTQNAYGTPVSQFSHHRTPSDQSYAHPLQSSPTFGGYSEIHSPHSPVATAQELPSVKSPVAFAHPQPRNRVPRTPSSPTIDPYFAQHPPRETSSAGASPRPI